MYVYIKSEPQLWTVDFSERLAANGCLEVTMSAGMTQRKVHWLNGGGNRRIAYASVHGWQIAGPVGRLEVGEGERKC